MQTCHRPVLLTLLSGDAGTTQVSSELVTSARDRRTPRDSGAQAHVHSGPSWTVSTDSKHPATYQETTLSMPSTPPCVRMVGPGRRTRRRSVDELVPPEGRGLVEEPGGCHGIRRLTLVCAHVRNDVLETGAGMELIGNRAWRENTPSPARTYSVGPNMPKWEICRSGHNTMDRDSEEAKEASSARKPELEGRRLMSAHRAGSTRDPAT